ncbi:MAG: TatD family hydrolase [Actinomycetota bacterium]|nr:TatD family hydrolase [Actinomycetota bacterium]
MKTSSAKDLDKKHFLIDTHAHLDMIKDKTPKEVINDAAGANVRYIINTGSDIEGSMKSVQFAKKYENVFATVGVHPHHADTFSSKEILVLENLIKENKKIVAVGEAGFDYFKNPVPKAEQERTFALQIELAIKYRLPVVIHDREAHEDTLRMIKKYSSEKNFKAVLHCFSGDLDFASKCIEEGVFISFTGVLTFPNAKATKEVAKIMPLEKIFLETDAPFLAPQPKRGKENYPSYVTYVAHELALLRGMDFDEIAAATTKNANLFFGLNI